MILLDPRDRRPIYEQIAGRFTELMAQGVLNPGDSLPSVRSLAAELSINPNTVQRAYLELERKGLIYTAKGKGSRVAGGEEILQAARDGIFAELGALAEKAKAVGITREEFLKEADRRFDPENHTAGV